MGRFLLTEPWLSNSGPLSLYTIEIGANDFAFILGALEELAIPGNWDIQEGLISNTEDLEAFRLEIAMVYVDLIEKIIESETLIG